jgi:large subunit ribosomal protein L21
MSYAIITVGGKQYRVREGERLLVDRLKAEEGKTFNPRVLLVGGNGGADLAPSATVTARVVGHVLGDKVRIGKYRRRTGYRRHTGFRSSLTEIQIESIGGAPPEQEREQPAEAAVTAAGERREELPEGYGELTVAQVAEAAPGWPRPGLEAALEHERGHGNRKGALAALEAALAEKETD